MNSNEIDLNEAIAEQEKRLRQFLGDGISLQVILAEKSARVEGVESLLGQTLLALLEHARLMLPGGGEVIVQVEQLEVDETHARIQPGARRGEHVRLTVSNNGLGLRSEALKRLFEETSTGWNPEVLALPLIAGMVRRRCGWIEATSQEGCGSMLAVYLPVAAAASKTVPMANGCVETILLVDDEAPIRRMVKSVLQRASYEVIEAETGVQALSIWEGHKDRVNLLLTDMVMPDGVTGRDLAQQLKYSKPGLSVIYTSGYQLDADSARDTAEKGVHFLQKPYDMRRLLETVHLAMAGKIAGPRQANPTAASA